MPVEQKQHSYHSKKSSKTSVRDVLNTSDLFNLYNMLNMVKVDLLWGRQDSEEGSESTASPVEKLSKQPETQYKQKSASPAPSQPAVVVATTLDQNSNSSQSDLGSSIKGHIRRPSTVSVSSANSVSTLSDSDSEISAENDSGIESESNADQDKSTELAKQFRTHLLGLYRSLEQMTEAANYLTARYQSDVGPV